MVTYSKVYFRHHLTQFHLQFTALYAKASTTFHLPVMGS